jgi:hypothetical protein
MEFGLDVSFLLLNTKACMYCMGLGSAGRGTERGGGGLE